MLQNLHTISDFHKDTIVGKLNLTSPLFQISAVSLKDSQL